MQVRCSAYLYQVSVKQAVKAAVSGGSGWGREGSCSVLGFRGGARAFHELKERRSSQPRYKGCLRHNLQPSSLILSPFQTTEGEGIEREVTARRAGQKVVIPPQFPPKKSKPDPQKPTSPPPRTQENLPLPPSEVSLAFVQCSYIQHPVVALPCRCQSTCTNPMWSRCHVQTSMLK